MKIEQIRRALEIANTKSINRASQNLYMAQSSLSCSIQALEEELGEKIFFRSQEGVGLTSFGERFIDHAREILWHVGQIELLSTVIPQEVPPRLDIMVYYLYFVSHAWSSMCNLHKNENITFNYMERTRSEIISGVSAGKAELGFLMMPSVDREKWLSLMSAQGLDYTLISVESPFAIVGPNSEFYNFTRLTPTHLINRRMIVFPEENDLLMVIDRKICKKFFPGSYLSVCDRGSLIGILKDTGGYYLGTFNKKAYSKVAFYENLKNIPIENIDFHYEIGYVKRQNQSLSNYALEFLGLVNQMIA